MFRVRHFTSAFAKAFAETSWRDESGRSTKPYRFMLGQTAFNPHRFRGELNLINASHGPKKGSHASGVQIIVDRLYK
jgi:hypothetical protein